MISETGRPVKSAGDPSPTVDLSAYDNHWYNPGRSRAVQALWFFVGLPLLRSSVVPFSGLRVRLLRLFGATLGPGVVIKPGARVKHPWLLSVGAHTWIGEDCWIDNVAQVIVGNNVCLSQDAYLCTGNHDWKDPAFALLLGPIHICDGAWIGARAMVCPGVTVGRSAVLTAGGVARKHISEGEIHGGNPAVFLRVREISSR